MKIRSIIVDDHPLNIEVLSDLLLELSDEVSLLGTAQNGTEALTLIRSLQPDLVFLDVEMPDMNGFEVLAALDRIEFQTIFVTAFSHYAIQAIRFNALDYLVKPIDSKELSLAIKRFHNQKYASFNKQQINLALNNLRKENVQDQVLFLPTQDGGIKMALRDIVMVESERNYSIIHLAKGKKKLISKTLLYFEEMLDEKGFFRCHRSFLINGSHVDRIKNDSVLLKNEIRIPISRRRKAKTKEWLDKLGSG